ncbi:SUMO protein smt3 [Elasticomyces elasticus]|uniref:SUMO protein smt3 n=1 Tax=Elasticomyces elasticus TaxID=574655 RepID=A0AAN7WDT7_9PEZI|nr:SUMO protein smt3 [Elasticomyces elasticus]
MVSSSYDPERFDGSLENTHRITPAKDRLVTVVIRDNRDHNGAGMIFEVKYFGTLENPFNHFKAACCKTCKPMDGMRFRMENKAVLSTDTPATLNLRHNTTTIIRVFFAVPGLMCHACKSKGFPKSNGVIKPGTPVLAPVLMSPPSPFDAVTLVLEDQTGYAMNVKTVSTHGFEFVMQEYAQQAVRERELLRFIFDGEKLSPTDTPKEMGCIDNDRIEVFFEQLGG